MKITYQLHFSIQKGNMREQEQVVLGISFMNIIRCFDEFKLLFQKPIFSSLYN